MHIHGSGMNSNAVGLHSAIATDKAGAAQRAAEVRRKLAKNAQEIGAASSPEENFLIGQWTDSRHSQVESENQYHTSAAGKDTDFG